MIIPLAIACSLVAAPHAVSVTQGAVAPFDGLLMDTATALRLTQMADGCTSKALIDHRKCDADAAIEKKRADVLDAALSQRPKELEECSRALSDCDQVLARQQGIGNNRFVWALIGLSAGVVSGSVLTAYMLNH